MDVVLLCGGKGTRLKEAVFDRPKPMAEINNRPFMNMLLDHAIQFGFKRCILCVGHKKKYIKEQYKNGYKSLEIVFAEENQLLGTGGAVKNSEPLIKSDPFLVMNGDSFCPVPLDMFIQFHQIKIAEFSLALIKNKTPTTDCGVVTLDQSERVTGFDEKVMNVDCFLNAGVYLFGKKIFTLIPEKTIYSLEYDVFPKLINQRVYGYEVDLDLIDIGTPERYHKARKVFKTS